MPAAPQKIAVFTGTRAEYGLLKPLLAELRARSEFALQLIVSGAHLSAAHGNTWQEIEADGLPVSAKVDMGLSTDDPRAITDALGRGVQGFGAVLADLQPDALVLVGDRYEVLGMAGAALIANVPIIHIHGGEVTEGAIDDAIRHAVSKMARFHFVAAEPFRRRLLQMGEAADTVWTVGSLGLDNIATLDPIPLDVICADLGLICARPVFLLTFHPVTAMGQAGLDELTALLAALNEVEATVIVTGTNVDAGNQAVHDHLSAFVAAQPEQRVMVPSLGMRRYLSAMQQADLVIGNSSSGLLEAPALGTPTVNVGNRQSGRPMAPSVLSVAGERTAIARAIAEALSADHQTLSAACETPYGMAGTANRILDLLVDIDFAAIGPKQFVDQVSADD